MSMKHVLSAGIGLLTLGLIATAAEAAPTTGFAGATVAEAAGAGLLEKAHWYGRRYHYRPYYYGYHYYPRYYGYRYYPRYDYYPRYWHRHHRHHY